MLATEFGQLDEGLRESDLDDLFYLFGALKVASCGASDESFMAVEDLLEGIFVAGEYEFDKLGIGPHGAHGSAYDMFVAGVAKYAFRLESFPYACHSSLRVIFRTVRREGRRAPDHGYRKFRNELRLAEEKSFHSSLTRSLSLAVLTSVSTTASRLIGP